MWIGDQSIHQHCLASSFFRVSALDGGLEGFWVPARDARRMQSTSRHFVFLGSHVSVITVCVCDVDRGIGVGTGETAST